MPPGVRKVTIQPKAGGASSIIIKDGFTVETPQIDSTEPSSGSIGEEIMVRGFFFGTEKGKVTLHKKRCRVSQLDHGPTDRGERDTVRRTARSCSRN